MTIFIFGVIFFAFAMLALSVGVIFKKKTPLKGHCHKPVDGSDGCAACGEAGEGQSFETNDSLKTCASGACEELVDNIESLKQGQLQIKSTADKPFQMRP